MAMNSWKPAAIALALIALSCNEKFDGPFTPGSKNYVGDAWAADNDGDGVSDSVEHYVKGCAKPPEQCLEDAKALSAAAAPEDKSLDSVSAQPMFLAMGDIPAKPSLTFLPAGTPDTAYTLASDNPAVAAIDGHAVRAAGPGNTYVTVDAAGGHTARFAVTVTATVDSAGNHPPAVKITLPLAGVRFNGGQEFEFAGTATDPEEGALTGAAFTWTAKLFDGPGDPHPSEIFMQPGIATGHVLVPSLHDTDAAVFCRLYLKVKDSRGAIGRDSLDIQPNKAAITLTSDPVGAALMVDGHPRVAPFTFDAVAGFQRAVAAADTQVIGGGTYVFQAWSDKSLAETTFVIPGSATTYTATFKKAVIDTIPDSTAKRWTVLGNAGFNFDRVDDFAFTVDGGKPTVLFSDASKSGRATAMQFSGGAWTILGKAGFSTDPVSVPTVAVANGIVYAAFNESNWGTCWVFKDGAWTRDTTLYLKDPAGMNLTLGLKDTLYLTWTGRIEYLIGMLKSGGGGWAPVGPDTGIVEDRKISEPLTRVHNGIPYVAVREAVPMYKGSVQKLSGNAWTQVGPKAFTPGMAYGPSLDFVQDEPWYAFTDTYNDSTRLSVLRFTGGIWQQAGTRIAPAGETANTQLAVDGETPYLAFGEHFPDNKDRETVMKYGAGAWSLIPYPNLPELFHNVKFAISGGVLYLAFIDWTTVDRITVMAYQ